MRHDSLYQAKVLEVFLSLNRSVDFWHILWRIRTACVGSRLQRWALLRYLRQRKWGEHLIFLLAAIILFPFHQYRSVLHTQNWRLNGMAPDRHKQLQLHLRMWRRILGAGKLDFRAITANRLHLI